MVFEQILNNLHISSKPAYCNKYVDVLTTEMRLKRITKRQMDSASMFNRLQVIIDQIEENFQPPMCTEVDAKDPAFIADHNYAYSNASSGVSSSSSTASPPPARNEQRFYQRTHNSLSAKRKIIDDEYEEFSADYDVITSPINCVQQQNNYTYPQQVGDRVLLGPNGTDIDVKSYSSIIWSSSASATRQLLAFVFSSDILATHTLTGKPSPAFYGRERPAKMQLDPIKAADIIHCVKSKFQCTEREIRAAITTKCSDTSKKYKRRCQKQMDTMVH